MSELLPLVLFAIGVVFLFVSVGIFHFIRSAKNLPRCETSNSNVRHTTHSGAHRAHGMVKGTHGKVFADSKLSRSYLESMF